MIVLVHIDGINDNEVEYIKAQAELIGISLDEYFKNKDKLEEINFALISIQMKKIIIRDLIVLAYIDNNYSDSEKTHLKNMTKDMGLQPDIVDKMVSELLEYS